MMTLNILYHMARADFLERTRRYSFLVMLGLVLWLGYLVNIGQITLRLDEIRGVFNSAWVGSMMTLVVNFMLGWFGFYLVKNSIGRDYDTGVGQIIATTPITRPVYLLGKWLSNFLVLDVMVFVLMLAAVVMQLVQREDAQIHLWALLAPFLVVALPCMALVAALAVLFETISWLRGGFGNLVYFFLFIGGIAILAIEVGVNVPLFDWLGFGIFKNSMAAAASAAYPDYQGGLILGAAPIDGELRSFYWPGVAWTGTLVLSRQVTYLWALGLLLLSTLFFDRFDAAPRNRRSLRGSLRRLLHRSQPAADEPAALEIAVELVAPAAPVHLSPLPDAARRFRPARLALAELRLLLKGLGWWWYLVALGLIGACFLAEPENLRSAVLPACLIWPLLVWSKLGSREASFNTGPLVFSAPHALRNQLPPAWLAGFGVALLFGGGAALRLFLAGDTAGTLALLAGLAFIPSLALALGVWTGSSKAFEVLYVLFWYLGLLNRVTELDYVGLHSPALWPVYLGLALVLFGLALVGRRRQLV